METLNDKIMKLAAEGMAPAVKTLVGHKFPDDDVWLSFWIARKFIPNAAKAEIRFVEAGTCLPGSDNDPTVLHFDTGRGEYDQHGTQFERTCSALILAQKLGVDKDPGLIELLEMVTQVDNTEKMSPTSLHSAIVGYPRHPNYRTQGAIDWEKVQNSVFELFDNVYGQETSRAKARVDLKQFGRCRTLANGLKVCTLFGYPQSRDAAFEDGAAVVIWTTRRKQGKFHVGIQKNSRDPLYVELKLTEVAAWLRKGEAGLRGIDVDGTDLNYIDRYGPITTWFLHHSLNLILNGSKKWEPKEDEYTQLTPTQIEARVCYILSKANL